MLDALAGGEPPDARMVAPPPFVGAPPLRTHAAPGKAVYGESLPHHLDGANFTVQWEDEAVDPDRAAAILAELEAAWTVLVAEGGWPAPISSDTWLLWVILDPELGGSGYTTVYTDDRYPEGYPVTWLNPVYDLDDGPAFGLSVAVHEFAHMLQYRLRDWELGSEDSWYWEATAEWAAEHVSPELDTYAESTFWYAEWPDARFDTIARWHGYGMLLLDAYLDERISGFDGIRDVWLASAGGDTAWDALIAGVTGEDFDVLVAGMAAEVAAGTLREADLYFEPTRVATHDTVPGWETLDLPGLYGTHYVDIGVSAPGFTVEGPARVAYVQDGVVSAEPPAEGAFTLVLTATAEEGDLRYGVPPADAPEEEPAACGCGTPVPRGFPVVSVAAAALLSRRRRLSGAGPPS